MPASAVADAYSDGATKFIRSLADQAISSLGAATLTPKEREANFRSVLRERFAVDVIGRWVLGRHWRKASEDERREYLKLFEDLIVKTYMSRFNGFTSERLEIDSAKKVGDKNAVVYSRLVRGNGASAVQIEWKVTSPTGKYQITDIVVEGISLAQTQRAEFGSVIQQNGGKVSGLLAVLRDKTNKLGSSLN